MNPAGAPCAKLGVIGAPTIADDTHNSPSFLIQFIMTPLCCSRQNRLSARQTFRRDSVSALIAIPFQGTLQTLCVRTALDRYAPSANGWQAADRLLRAQA